VVVVATTLVVGGVVAGATVGGDGGRDARGASAASTTSTTSARTTSTEQAPADDGDEQESTTTSSRIDFLSEPIGPRMVFLVAEAEVVVVDLDANVVRRVPHEIKIASDGRAGAIAFAAGTSGVFLAGGGRIHFLGRNAQGPPDDIGEAIVAIPSTTAGRAWVARERGGGFVLVEIDTGGRETRTSARLPDDMTPVGSAGDTVVLQSAADALVAWSPATGTASWTTDSAAEYIGSSRGRVVWRRPCSSPLCTVHVTDPATGRDETIPIPEFGVGWSSSYEVDPTGRYLGALTGEYRRDSAAFEVVVVDLETRLVAAEEAFEPGDLAWSPDGRWLFQSGEADFGLQLRWAYRLDGSSLRRVDLRLPERYQTLATVVL